MVGADVGARDGTPVGAMVGAPIYVNAKQYIEY
jgi:hypothetical protein